MCSSPFVFVDCQTNPAAAAAKKQVGFELFQFQNQQARQRQEQPHQAILTERGGLPTARIHYKALTN